MKDVQFIIDKIKGLAEEKNISINKLLSECKLNPSLVSDMQGKGTFPSIKAISKIAEYFDVTVEYLIGNCDLPSNQSALASSQFGKTLRQLRQQHSFTQADLAEKLGLSKANVCKYEAGSVEPNIDTLLRLSELFNVSVDYLLGHNSPVMAGKPPRKIILNRGKALKSGEWIYGAYISIRNENAYIQKLLWELVDETFPPPVEIDPHTAGRYTQGNDMNGNEIFEDDLITGASGQVMCIRYGISGILSGGRSVYAQRGVLCGSPRLSGHANRLHKPVCNEDWQHPRQS